MANHFDLEEQEQLDRLKHFWTQYGNAITWLLILVLGAFAAWNGYQFWERRQAAQASALYDEVERAAGGSDAAMFERALTDLKERHAGSTFAAQAGLLAARYYHEKQNADAAQAQLRWVMDKASDPGYQAIARLRLAALLIEAKKLDEALQLLSTSVPASFEALVADRKGDVLSLQGKREEAKQAYLQAHAKADLNPEFLRLLEIKLNALGVDPKTLSRGAAKEASK